MEAEFLSNVGHIQSDPVREIVERVRKTGMQIAILSDWEKFSISPERVVTENEQLVSLIYDHRDAILCWLIASHVIGKSPCDSDWFDILSTSLEASPDLNDTYAGNIIKLEAACQRADLEATKQHARRAVTCWDAMASQHKRIAEAPDAN